MQSFEHLPVLLSETVSNLVHTEDGLYVDCTVGGGGHSAAILAQSPHCRLLGIDQDREALAAAQERLAPFGERAFFVWDNFRNLDRILSDNHITHADGFLFDLGVSSYQLDESTRGFSYQADAPLDMRMDRDGDGQTACDLLNQLPEEELSRIIYSYGEERWAARIANFIVAARQQKPLTTTAELVEIIKNAVPKKAREGGPHPAKRTFQALRIAVNNELNIIEPAILAAAEHLKPGGRIAVISFHSLEDRIVKETFRYLARDCICPPGQIVCTCDKKQTVRIITRKPLTASDAELAENPRSRSAKLRVCEGIAE